MANEQSIDEIISQAAFDQISKLQEDLKNTNKVFIDTVGSVTILNQAIANAKTFATFTKSASDANLAVEKLAQAQLATQAATDKVSAAQAKYANEEAVRSAARQASADKEIAKQADIVAALDKKTKTVISNSQEEVDAYNRVENAANEAVNAEDRASAVKSNSAASISGQSAPIASTGNNTSDLSNQEQALQAYIKTSIQLKIEIDELKASQKSLNDQFKNGDINEAQLADQTTVLASKIAVLGVALNENNAQIKAQAQNVASAKGSYTDLQAQLSGLTVAYKSLSEADRNAAEGKALQKEILDLTNKLKELDAGIGVHNRNVGNYGAAFNGLANNISNLVPGVGTLNNVIQSGAGIIENATSVFDAYLGKVSTIKAAQDSLAEATEVATAASAASSAANLTAAETQLAASAAEELAIKAKQDLGLAQLALVDLILSSEVANLSDAESLQIANAIKEQSIVVTNLLTVSQNLNTESIVANTAAKIANSIATEANATATETQSVAQVAATTATEAGTLGLRGFKVALLSTGIGALIIALGALYTYFTQTQDGINAVIKVVEPLKVGFRLLVEGLEDFGRAIVNVFSVKGILAFGQAIETNIINRFKGLAEIVKGIYNFDFKQTANGIIEVGTGISNAIDKTQAFIKTSVDLGGEIAKLKIARDAENATLDEQVSKYTEILAKNQEIARDTSKTTSVRASASKAALDAINSRLALQLKVENDSLKIIQLENSTRAKTNATIKEESDIRKKINEDEAAAEKARTRVTSTLNRINKAPAGAATAGIDAHKAEIQGNADAQKAIYDDLTKSLDERYSAIVNFEKLTEQLNALDAAKRIQKAKGNAGLLLAAEADERTADAKAQIVANDLKVKLNKEATAALKKDLDEGLKAVTKQEQDQVVAIKDSNDEKLQDIELFKNEAIQGVNEQYAAGKLSDKQYQQQLKDIDLQASQDRVQAQIDAVQKIIDVEKAFLSFGIGSNKQLGDDERNLANLKIQYSANATKAQIDDTKKVAEARKQLQDLEFQFGKELITFTATVVDANFKSQEDSVDDQTTLLTAQTQSQIDAVNNTTDSEQGKADKIAAINAKAAEQQAVLDQKKRDLQTKQAKFDRAISIANIIANTAEAVMKTYAETGFPLGIPLAIAQAAIGAVQIATVLATPLPKFEHGGTMAKTGLAVYGEVGTELMIDPSGSLSLTPSTPTIANVQGGTQFISNKDLMRSLANGESISHRGRDLDLTPIANEISKGNKSVVKAIKGQQTIVTNSKRGFMKDNEAARRMNDYLRRNIQ